MSISILKESNLSKEKRKSSMAELVRMSSTGIIPRSSSSSSSSSSSPLPSYRGQHTTTELRPQDAWLPITASRNGNVYFSIFHILNTGIGFQVLALPVAFTVLGWSWGIILLSLGFVWQLYTMWLLVQLHESVPGTRYSRYLHLSIAAFGGRLGKLLAMFPTMVLSSGTCVTLLLTAGASMRTFFDIACGHSCKSGPLSAIEWYLVLLIIAIIIAQLPTLNSMAGVSFIGAVAALTYCTSIWIISVAKTRPTDISYDPVKAKSNIDKVYSIFNALGIVVVAFRRHNLILEIQGTMPSTEEHPSRVPMWRAVKFANLLIALCIFSIAIGVYWAYGNKIQNANGRMLRTLYSIHEQDQTTRLIFAIVSLLIVIHSISSFQIYAMPAIDNLEDIYTRKMKDPCSLSAHVALRVLFGCIIFLVAVAFPFVINVPGIIGGITLPVKLAYPCFMWISIKKPKRWTAMWHINWMLGSFGIVLSVMVLAGAIYRVVNPGINIRFFKP